MYETGTIFAAKMQSDGDRRSWDRNKFLYSSPLLVDNPDISGYPQTCWPIPNLWVRLVKYGLPLQNVPTDRATQRNKRNKFDELRRFVREHDGEDALCEAFDMHPCYGNDCPFFDGTICTEFKIAFRLTPEEPRRTTLPHIA